MTLVDGELKPIFGASSAFGVNPIPANKNFGLSSGLLNVKGSMGFGAVVSVPKLNVLDACPN